MKNIYFYNVKMGRCKLEENFKICPKCKGFGVREYYITFDIIRPPVCASCDGKEF